MKHRLSRHPGICDLGYCLNGCAASGEQELLQEVEAAMGKARTLDGGDSAASVAYQEAIDVMTRYLNQFPDGEKAAEIRDQRERFYSELRQLRDSGAAYEALLKQEPNESQPQLPSAAFFCRAACRVAAVRVTSEVIGPALAGGWHTSLGSCGWLSFGSCLSSAS